MTLWPYQVFPFYFSSAPCNMVLLLPCNERRTGPRKPSAYSPRIKGIEVYFLVRPDDYRWHPRFTPWPGTRPPLPLNERKETRPGVLVSSDPTRSEVLWTSHTLWPMVGTEVFLMDTWKILCVFFKNDLTWPCSKVHSPKTFSRGSLSSTSGPTSGHYTSFTQDTKLWCKVNSSFCDAGVLPLDEGILGHLKWDELPFCTAPIGTGRHDDYKTRTNSKTDVYIPWSVYVYPTNVFPENSVRLDWTNRTSFYMTPGL